MFQCPSDPCDMIWPVWYLQMLLGLFSYTTSHNYLPWCSDISETITSWSQYQPWVFWKWLFNLRISCKNMREADYQQGKFPPHYTMPDTRTQVIQQSVLQIASRLMGQDKKGPQEWIRDSAVQSPPSPYYHWQDSNSHPMPGSPIW